MSRCSEQEAFADWTNHYGLPLIDGSTCVTISTYVGLFRCINKISDLIVRYLSTLDGGDYGNDFWDLSEEESQLRQVDCWYEPVKLCVDDSSIFLGDHNIKEEYSKDQSVYGIMERCWRCSTYMANKSAISNGTRISRDFSEIFEKDYCLKPRYSLLVKDILNESSVTNRTNTDGCIALFNEFIKFKYDQCKDEPTLDPDHMYNYVDSKCVLSDLINTSWAMVEALRRNLAFVWLQSYNNPVDEIDPFFAGTYRYYQGGPRFTMNFSKVIKLNRLDTVCVCQKEDQTECDEDIEPLTALEANRLSQEKNTKRAKDLLTDGYNPDTGEKEFWSRDNAEINPGAAVSVLHNQGAGYACKCFAHSPVYRASYYVISSIKWSDDYEISTDANTYKTFVIPTILDELPLGPFWEGYDTYSTTTTTTEDNTYSCDGSGEINDRYLNLFGKHSLSQMLKITHVTHVNKTGGNIYRVDINEDDPELDPEYVYRLRVLHRDSTWFNSDSGNTFKKMINNTYINAYIISFTNIDDPVGEPDGDDYITPVLPYDESSLYSTEYRHGRFGYYLIPGCIAEMCVPVPTEPIDGTCEVPSDDDEGPTNETDLPLDPDDDDEDGNPEGVPPDAGGDPDESQEIILD